MHEHDTLISDIRSRQDLMKKLTAESSQVQEETDRVDAHNQMLTTRMEEYRVPSVFNIYFIFFLKRAVMLMQICSAQVMDYIGLKAKQQELEAQVSAWKRKVDVQKMNRSRYVYHIDSLLFS